MPALFPIMLEVEEGELGTVLVLLKDRPGIRIHLDLDNVAKKSGRQTGKSNGQDRKSYRKRDPEAPTGKSVVIAELMSGQKNLAYLKAKFQEHNLSPGAVSSTLYDLHQKGITESAGIGLHRLTDHALAELGQQSQPKDESLQLPAPEVTPPSKRGESRPFVIKCIEEGKTRLEMAKAALPLGITERAVDGALTRLKKEKIIVGNKNNPGVYTIVPQKAAKSKTHATKE